MEESQEPTAKGGQLEDKIEEKLLENRRLFFCNTVETVSSKDIIRKLWYLELKDPGKPILFVINSPGGVMHDGFAILDTIHMITSPVTTLVTGLAASMGTVLSLAGGKGQRFATANSRIMIHQPRIMGLIQGQASDLEVQAEEIIKTRDHTIRLYMEATGKDFDTIAKAIDRDNWMTAEEAKEFGLIDKVVTSFSDV